MFAFIIFLQFVVTLGQLNGKEGLKLKEAPFVKSTTAESVYASESADFCKVPEPPLNGRLSVNGQPVGKFVPHLHELTVSCDKGYKMSGFRTRVLLFCHFDGQWNEPVPKCWEQWEPNEQDYSTNKPASDRLGLCVQLPSTVSAHVSLDGEEWFGLYAPGAEATISCYDGFEMEGGATSLYLFCQEDGEWSAPAPSQCHSINKMDEVASEVPNPDGSYTFHATVVTSGASGSYKSVSYCDVPRPPLNANLDVNVIYSGLLSEGSRGTISCKEGYQMDGGETIFKIVCRYDGWVEDIPKSSSEQKGRVFPVCQRVNESSSLDGSSPSNVDGPCSLPDPPQNRAFTLKNCSGNCSVSTVPHNGEVSVSCLPGYSLVDHGFINYAFSTKCKRGVWEPPVPVCRVVCPPLDSSALDFLCWRGLTIVNCEWALLPDTKVAYRCKANLENREGSSNGFTICRSNGQWSHQIPSCSEITCPNLYSPTVDFLCWQGPFLTSCTDQKMYPGTKVQYSCKEFYESNNPGPNGMTCNDNGQWSQEIPSCTPKTLCPPLVSLTETFSCYFESSEESNCTKPMLPGTRAYFTCAEGHEVTSLRASHTEGSLKCFPSGRWSQDPPYCSPIGSTGVECRVPDPPENRRFARYNCRGCSTESVPDAGLLVVTCDPGYSLVQGVYIQATRALANCLNGVWDPPIPQCLKLCPALSSQTVDLTCWLGRDLVSCNRPMLPNTLVEYSCKEYHETIDRNPNAIRCTSRGVWSRDLPNCSPQCGHSNLNSAELKPTILGGNFSSPGNFPWHAGIYHWKQGDWKAVCGGTLISPKLVLTAAHCVTIKCNKCSPPPVMATREIMVALGKTNRQWNHTEEAEVKKEIQEIFVHQYYVGSTLNYGHDIAVLVLRSDVKINNLVMPACVDHSLHYLKRLNEDSTLMGYVPGWGNTEECVSFGNVCSSPSDKLKYARTSIYNFTECYEITQKIKTFFLSRLTPDKYCAGNGSASVVQQGDSGGGLTFELNGLHYVYGVVSVKVILESKGKRHYAFGAFTSVPAHLSWLKTILY